MFMSFHFVLLSLMFSFWFSKFDTDFKMTILFISKTSLFIKYLLKGGPCLVLKGVEVNQ